MALLLVFAFPAWAQSSGACQNPQEVITVGPTTENTRTPFTTTGDVFRVSYDVAFEDPGPLDNANIDIEDSLGLVDYAIVDKDEKNSFIVTEGAGSYDLVVDIQPPNGATYTVTVEDCMGSETTTPPPTTPPTTTPPTTPPTTRRRLRHRLPAPRADTSPAPTTSPTPGQGAPGPDSECPGARVVNTTTGTGDKQRPFSG